ncbi:unnamed protein product [Rotaria sp. Silwood1]|nr:unnamed protein product [Rotaria sp. Silwood1]
MGSLLSVFSGLFGNKERRILILGLDGAGKTTILYRLQVSEVVTTIPTIGFNVETVQYKNLKFQVWDLGGQTSIRPYWRCYYSNTDAIIYVVDSMDRDRIGISKHELISMLEEDELKNAVLCVFANKQDLDGCMTVSDVANSLGLTSLKNRKYQIFKTSAIKGTGLNEAMDCQQQTDLSFHRHDITNSAVQNWSNQSGMKGILKTTTAPSICNLLSTTEDNQNGSICQFITLFPLIFLTQSDRTVLTNLENALLSRDDPSIVISHCHFLSNVVLNDFPAELFLQRSFIVKRLLALLNENDDDLIKASLSCLKDYSVNLQRRIKILRDPACFCPNHHLNKGITTS